MEILFLTFIVDTGFSNNDFNMKLFFIGMVKVLFFVENV